MLGKFSSVSILGLLIFLINCNAELPSPGKVYLIQSAMDGAYLKPLGSGAMCRSLSRISFIYRGNGTPFPNEYKWEVSYSNFTSSYTIFNKNTDSGYAINEFTFDDYPPYCYLVYRDLEIEQIGSGNTFTIRAPRIGKCATSYGSEIGSIMWLNCGDVGQNWYFHESAINETIRQ